MAIIYTYPTVIPEATDILLGTEVGATLRNPTRNFNIGEIAKFIIDSFNGTNLTVPLFISVVNPISGIAQIQLTDSIMTQDINPAGTTLTIAGNIVVTGTFADSAGSVGTLNQVLSSTVTGTAWTAVSSSTEVIAFNNVAVVTANHTGALGIWPSVTVVNQNNLVIFGEVSYITNTQLTITFTVAQTGNVYLN
tara:strand:+ start:630 stop:1208 length:579 start_codon:yes stop_codon:yes gene_type:complete